MTAITSFSGDYRWLSNFWLVQIRLGNDMFPSVENAYQAAKFPADHRSVFRLVKPGKAKRLGHTARLPKDWKDRRVAIMKFLIDQKFAYGSALADMLVQTGDAHLEEGNTWGDHFWGVCNGQGQNMLGQILMARRAFLIGRIYASIVTPD